ncbi:MAG: hypothetical protein COU30_00460 [Candidatus Magasanikbacteria bacterium CG10_big_fil_rev_8_21_14_0_10_38_6]|uniref:AAA+ ATPase domain-containing protein n=1 Tax=Candidatus Magasanikbacteria bacterium CG10_big_fil_rev_8_21_14_0_10_38_6 TaxID=1974647 RepID=A0A2M6P286_9BACT|nr:MAG: hypothetical protein COU30_00460 [Candidatus Magasanikbacteria bacterium CG10_big_fil_rev_8_21_14_0_10_38_6]
MEFLQLYGKSLLILVTGIVIAVYILIKKEHNDGNENKTTRRHSNTPLLDTYTTDFTQLAHIGKIDPVIGRYNEVLRLSQILSRRNKNNALLIGAPGVGKTAIVEGLAQRIAKHEVTETLQGKRVLSLDVANLLSGTKYRGEFEKRAKQLVQEISSSERSIILFIDEVHSVIQSQGSEGSVNFSDILKPALARGDLQMIGATTTDEYNAYIKTDPALERRFQTITVKEPTIKDTIAILQGVKDKYREYHKVQFTDAALETAANLTKKKIKNRTLPDKALDAIDEAASMVRVAHIKDTTHAVLYSAAVKKYPEVAAIWKKMQEVDNAFIQATPKKRKHLQKKREALEMKLEKTGVFIVDASDVETVIKQWIQELQS